MKIVRVMFLTNYNNYSNAEAPPTGPLVVTGAGTSEDVAPSLKPESGVVGGLLQSDTAPVAPLLPCSLLTPLLSAFVRAKRAWPVGIHH